MIYNSNPYKRKMETMSVNVSKPKSAQPAQSNLPKTEEPMVETQPILEQPVPFAPPAPELEVTPYVPDVEGVEVPAVSLEDIEPSNPVEEVVAAQPEEVEAPAEEVVEEVESEVEEAPVVDSSEPASPEEVEEVVEDEPVEEVEVETPADATGEETAAEEVPATHYFYCTKPDGKEVVYKRNTASASYESEIASFRKYLEKEGIIINKEEIK